MPDDDREHRERKKSKRLREEEERKSKKVKKMKQKVSSEKKDAKRCKTNHDGQLEAQIAELKAQLTEANGMLRLCKDWEPLQA
jgi:hypothetical protein